MTARIVLVADGEELVPRLRAALGAGSLQVVATEPSATLPDRIEATGDFDAVFCEFSAPNCDDRAGLVQMLVESFSPMPVVGVAVGDDGKLASAATRARARDFFVPGRDDARLATWLEQLRPGHRPSEAGAAVAAGRIVSVVSGHPYDGIAFLADHLTIALQEQVGQGERVLLLDLATPQGAGAIFLNLSPGYSALDAIADTERLDKACIDSRFSRHSSGIHVLSLPEQMLGRPQIDVQRLLRFLQTAAALFSYTVVALDGHHPLGLLARVVERADHSVLLSDQSILKSRQSKYLVQALRDAGCSLDRMGVVVDNYKYRLGLEPKNIAELFKLRLLGTLQTESFNRIVAMNAGEPLFTIAPKDPYCTGVRGLAATMCGGAPVIPAPTREKKRWKFF